VARQWRDSGGNSGVVGLAKKASKQHFANIFVQHSSSIESRMEKARALAIQSRFDIQVK
jgi:hypothetical protein